MWLFYLLYGRFRLYLAIDIVLNFIFIYVFHVYFLGSRDLFSELGITPFQNVLIVTFDGILAYGYQMWQEEIFVHAERKVSDTPLFTQTAVSKPLREEPDNENDN